MRLQWIEDLEARRLFAVLAPEVTFGNDGTLLPDANISGQDPAVTLVHADTHGLLVTTLTGDIQTPHLRLERFTLDGRLDPAFTPRDLPPDDVGIQYPFGDRRGRLLVLDYDYQNNALRVTRYNTDGTLDTSFGKNGITTAAALPAAGHDDYRYFHAFHLTDSPDGSIYLSGLDELSQPERSNRYLFKLTASGQIDTAFGDAGRVLAGKKNISLDFITSQRSDDGFTFATDSRGRLLVGQTPTGGQFRFTRYTSAGQVDPTYGKQGTFTYTTSNEPYNFDRFYAAYDAQGRALLLTNTSPGKLIRLTVNGHLDPSFGTDGVVTLPGRGKSLIVQDDGKILLQLAGARGDVYARLRTDGSPDVTFDGDGVADYVQTNRDSSAYADTAVYSPRLLTRLADGSYLTAASTIIGDTVEKIALATPVRRGASGTLYLLGGNGADSAVVTKNSAGATHVVFNGESYDFTDPITAVAANLFGGDNLYDAPVDVPQAVATGGGNDTVTTGDADDTVFTGNGNDTIATHGGYDTVHFYGGDKQIDAGSGSGYVTGGGGTERNYSGGPLGRITVVGTTTDGATQGGWKIDLRGTRVHVTLGGGSAAFYVVAKQTAVIDAAAVRSRVSADVTAKRVTFTAARATVRANIFDAISSTVTTGPGDDTLRGGRGRDTIDAGAGNDLIYGNAGDDSLIGGDGDDTLVGGPGDDTLLGGGGRNRLYAGDA